MMSITKVYLGNYDFINIAGVKHFFCGKSFANIQVMLTVKVKI